MSRRRSVRHGGAGLAVGVGLLLAVVALGPAATASTNPALSVIRSITVGSYPWGVAVASNGDVYVTNSGAGTVSVINSSTNQVVGTPITVGSQPGDVAVGSNGDVYVTNQVVLIRCRSLIRRRTL